MADESQGTGTDNAPEPAPPVRIHVMQQLLDNPFLLLVLGITVPTVLYLIWGVMEIISVPLAE